MTLRSAHADDADLLAPVLRERDDATGFNGRPWHPWALVPWAVFAGAIGTGALYAVNFHRLGQRRAVVSCALAFAALAILLTWMPFLLDARARESTKLVTRAVPVILGAIAAGLQQQRFRVFANSGGDVPGTLRVGLLAIAFGLACHVALGVVFVAALGDPA